MSDRQRPRLVTLRSKPLNLDPRIAPDAKWPTMFRLRLPDGGLSDMVNLPRAKDALAAFPLGLRDEILVPALVRY
jgi:hypothetical protein